MFGQSDGDGREQERLGGERGKRKREYTGRHCPQPCSLFSSRLFSKVLKAGCSRWLPPVEDVTVECIDFIKAISVQGSRLPWRRCELSMWPCVMEQSKPYWETFYKCILNAPLKALFISMDWLVRKVLKSCPTPGSAASISDGIFYLYLLWLILIKGIWWHKDIWWHTLELAFKKIKVVDVLWLIEMKQ